MVMPEGCSNGTVSLGWGDGTTGALFGITRLSGRPIKDGTLVVEDASVHWSRTVKVEKDQGLLKLTPLQSGSGKSINFGCNVLDHAVWVNPSTGMPQRCDSGDGVWILDHGEIGSGTSIILGQVADAASHFLPLLPSDGILPPQSESPLPAKFPLKAAFTSAMSDKQWSSYASQRDRNVVLSDAYATEGSTTCLATLCSTSLTWTFDLAADGQDGLSAQVTRMFPPTGPSPPDDIKVGPGEVSRHIGPLSTEMAGVDDARLAVGALLGTPVTSLHVFDDDYGHRPRYTYTFSLGQHCFDPQCLGSTYDTLVIDSTSGSLMAATLQERQARVFIPK
jgi:hypothetical protein